MGEVLALTSAAFYGMAGITIQKGKETRAGDGGVFLSVMTTALLTGALWVLLGRSNADVLGTADGRRAVVIFALAGVFATVLGRLFMYRTTEELGPLGASMLRRMIPLFAIPLGMIVVHEWPSLTDLAGGALLILGVVVFSSRPTGAWTALGIALGLGSALWYALSYTLRKYSLGLVPDPVLGTFIGAAAGVGCYGLWMVLSGAPRARWRFLTTDRGPWFLLTAGLLSCGQLLQLVALQASSVATVAFIGSTDVLFTALFTALIFGSPLLRNIRVIVALALVLLGTGLLM